MKKRRRFIILLTFFLYLPGIPLIQHVRSREGIAVLEYHEIVDDVLKRRTHNHYTLSESSFRREMKYLYDHHIHTLSLAELEDYYEGRQDVSHAVVLTFDDGYATFNTIVKPILEEYQLKATCFVIGHHLNDDNPRFLHKADIVNDALCSYYSHSYDLHHKARGFNKKRIETLSLEDIAEDFAKNPVDATYYAFPYGRSVKGIIPILKANHVRLAFSDNQHVHMTRASPRYFLPRYLMVDVTPFWYYQFLVK